MDRYWLLTSRTYGTWLPGDERGFVGTVVGADGRRVLHNEPGTPWEKGNAPLRAYARSHMRGDPLLLMAQQAPPLLGQFLETASYRGWELLAVAILINHVHLVVAVPGDPDPAKLLGDFKGYGSRCLNRGWGKPQSGTWWVEGGSRRPLKTTEAVAAAIRYVLNQTAPLLIWSRQEAGAAPASGRREPAGEQPPEASGRREPAGHALAPDPSSPPREAAVQPAEIYRQTTRHFLKPIVTLLDDPSVSEVMINGPDDIYFERAGRIHKADGVRFADNAALMAAARNVAEYVNRRIDDNHHSMDARLPDGSRVHVIIPPASRQGVCFSIRKFMKSLFDLDKLIERGSLSPIAAEFLRLIVALHKNTVVAGGTGTGKTSMLNALSTAIPAHERIIVIEDSSELQLYQPHTLYLEAQPPRPDGHGGVTIRDLFVDSLRMRPDRIVVGEVRRGEALDLIQSMLSGHAGSLTTVHASTPRDAAVRLETLCLMSDVALPVQVSRMQVASALHLVVQLARFGDGSRRVQKITEMLGLDDHGAYIVRDLFVFVPTGLDAEGRIQGELRATGERPTFADEPHALGLGAMINLTRDLFAPGEAG